MGSTFGQFDNNATNDVLNGDTVATGTAGAKTVADPMGGLSDAQMRNRKLAKFGMGGLGQILTSQNQQQSPYGHPVNFTFADNQPQMYSPPARTQNPFFGSY